MYVAIGLKVLIMAYRDIQMVSLFSLTVSNLFLNQCFDISDVVYDVLHVFQILLQSVLTLIVAFFCKSNLRC